jgi:hypothetical protein
VPTGKERTSADLTRALGQIADIQRQLAKGEIYRGYRPLPVAASGVIGLVAAWLQDPALGGTDPMGFVLYWIVVAGCAIAVGAVEIVHHYAVSEGSAERRRTRLVIGQFLPGVAAAAIVTGCFAHVSAALVPLLPGIWALGMGVGIFASRPYLPRASGWVALFYYAAGAILLWNARALDTLSGWSVGGTFGAGQLFAAAVLYWNVERHSQSD